MITISDSARQHIEESLQKSKQLFFHLSLKKMGCSGYAYQVNLVSEMRATDACLEINGLNILIDKTWESVLGNVSIDYVSDANSPLKTKKLVFSHPDIEDHCGCGESFYIPGK